MVALLSIISRFLIFIILCYQSYISILYLPCCRFYPTCSQYAINAFRCFGIMKALFLIVKRVLKCHPLHTGGIDRLFSIKTKNK